MVMKIDKPYGFSVDKPAISGAYSFEFQNCDNNCNKNRVVLNFEQLGKYAKITNKENSVEIEVRDCFVLKELIEFFKEIIETHEIYKK